MCALAALVGLVINPVSAVRAYVGGAVGIVKTPDAAADVAVSHLVLDAFCLEAAAVSGVIGVARSVRNGEVTGNARAWLCAHVEQMVNVGLVIDLIAPDVLAVCYLTGQTCGGRVYAEGENHVKVADLTAVHQGSVACVLPCVGRIDILHTDVQVGAVPAGKQRVGVDQAVFVRALPMVGAIPCRAGGNKHVLRPVG